MIAFFKSTFFVGPFRSWTREVFASDQWEKTAALFFTVKQKVSATLRCVSIFKINSIDFQSSKRKSCIFTQFHTNRRAMRLFSCLLFSLIFALCSTLIDYRDIFAEQKHRKGREENKKTLKEEKKTVEEIFHSPEKTK